MQETKRTKARCRGKCGPSTKQAWQRLREMLNRAQYWPLKLVSSKVEVTRQIQKSHLAKWLRSYSVTQAVPRLLFRGLKFYHHGCIFMVALNMFICEPHI
jgi:hypothetical protein